MCKQLSNYIREKIIISDEVMEKVLSFFKFVQVKKNEILISPGETCQRIYFVDKGCLRIFFLTAGGTEATRHFAFENQFATALVSFITNETSKEFVQAVEDTNLSYISQNDFYSLLQIVPQWEKLYRHYLEYAYVTNTNRLMSFITLDATARYRQLLAQNPSIVMRLPNKMVASYLNISQETLSRLKSKA
ncbi:Crp/Fnr family transcriptional regulator [Pedobacter sp. KACC 23697]|uniref:Crp/Fnr family transcriptional regulator n=1 Tax=Pedobacter sp. KACC 23697 TaxID=3149230 RepID=A0AAU7K3B5_9SPHI